MLNYNIIDPFPARGNPVERDSAPKSVQEMHQDEIQKRSNDRAKSLINNLVSILK